MGVLQGLLHGLRKGSRKVLGFRVLGLGGVPGLGFRVKRHGLILES